MNDKTYRIYDSTLNIWSDVPGTDFMRFDKDLLNSMKRTLKKAGYSFRQDVKVAKCIRRGYYVGGKDDVFFAAEAGARGLKIEFYEDVIRDNKCGGRYHFDKMAKMPYLRRQKVNLIHQKLAARLEILGFRDATPVPSSRAWAFVQQERAGLMAFQGERFYEDERYQGYGNSEDADGKLIVEGQLKYCRNYWGELRRGFAWRHINNMWWVICSESEVYNIAAFDLFDWDPARHKRREVRNPAGRVERLLQKAVAAQQFEKAIGLRDALRRMSKEAVTV
jgi:hypothetical protein